MSANFGYIDELKAIEHSTLKVPYETLNKLYRNVQKAIDRDCSSISQIVSKLNDANPNDLINASNTAIEKLRAIKKRSMDLRNEERELLGLLKKRIEHLKDHDSSDQLISKNFKRLRLERMLIDYFLRTGFYETAQLLANQSEIQDMTNIDIFLVEKEIVDSLLNKETTKCLAWCNENKSKLKKINSNLEFSLRQQEFIELVRSQRCVEAVHHARKHFNANAVNATQLIEVQKSMVLLAYVKSPDPAQELLNENRWNFLIELFKQDNYKIHQLPEQSSFIAVLQAGLSSMKTPTCYKKVTAIKNLNCPVCHPTFNLIARPLPYAYCSNSKLICAYTGAQINENNVPMMLPNGYVYSYNALLKMLSENNGKIVCPRSQEVYEFNEALKVFIL
jgi:macrophage erythroblast attacher